MTKSRMRCTWCVPCMALRVPAHTAHQSKVTELEEGRLRACDQHVCRLDVPVHDLACVAELYRIHQLLEKVAGHLLTHRVAGQVVRQRAACSRNSRQGCSSSGRDVVEPAGVVPCLLAEVPVSTKASAGRTRVLQRVMLCSLTGSAQLLAPLVYAVSLLLLKLLAVAKCHAAALPCCPLPSPRMLLWRARHGLLSLGLLP